ncbi:MAG: hypothetical protein GZ091_15445 [Paludibacter sp.]|nr:hypothetical protein [Paludibacter sp.]
MLTKNELTFNILAFNHVSERIRIAISNNPLSEGGFKLSDRDAKQFASFLDPSKGSGDLFVSSVGSKQAQSTEIELAVSPRHCQPNEKCWSISFLKKYYTLKLTEHFKAIGIPVQTNFVSDTDVWIKCRSPYPNCDGYRVFSLRVQFTAPAYTPELVIIVGDVHSVFNKPISDDLFSEMPHDSFGKVLYNNEIHLFNQLSDTARRQMDKVYPCISFKLLHALKLVRPAPDKSNRYLKYWKELVDFRATFLTDKEIANFMHLESAWKTAVPERLTNEKKEVQFGNGTHDEPKYGMRLHGPKTLIEDNVIFFFILHSTDKALAVTINDYLKGIESKFNGGLSGYLKMKYTTELNLSIVFEDKNNPIAEICAKIKEKSILSNASKRYVAIYLSPHSKITQNSQHKAIYYQLKEQLLLRGIVSQTIDANKTWGYGRPTEEVNGKIRAALSSNFQYSLPNIFVAIHAKLGGTPWCLESQASDELVIGISAYRSRDLDKQYLGSTFSFTNEGKFQGFDCFKSSQVAVLAGSIALKVKNYCQEKQDLKRLVIHFYKRLSWRELKPIEKALSELGMSVPVVIVSINKAYSDDLVGFDLSSEHLMPLSGTFVALHNSQYLLYNNQLLKGLEKINEREGYPFPLKITIQQFLPDKNESIATSPEDTISLLEQVCRFSQLYWKSVSRQWMPVTLRYPEMLAQIFPHFKYKDLTESGSESLWFL